MESKEYRELREAANLLVGYIDGVLSAPRMGPESDAEMRRTSLEFTLRTLKTALEAQDEPF